MLGYKDFVENIKSRQTSSDSDVLDSLTGAIDRLQKAFPRYGSFLMEFIQNADDAKSKSLRIKFIDDKLVISNDGLPFSAEDVRSICKVGRSLKTPKDYIGYLGVGFKAVFLISEGPEIYSGGYKFKFSKAYWPNAQHIPWQVIPIWIDVPTVTSSEQTTFVLPVKTPELIEKLREEIKPEQLNKRILLFLRNVKEINVSDEHNSLKRRIVKLEAVDTSQHEICQIQEYDGDKIVSDDKWLVFRDVHEVPDHVRKDYMTQEWERGDVEKREILIAFKLNDEGNLVKEVKGTAHIGVFSFLPLKEIPSGMNFLIQADFLTAPGRGELARKCVWNDWLAKEIFNLIVGKCVPVFLSHERWKTNLTDILYSSEGGHELFSEHIKDPLNDYLTKSEVLIAEDETTAKAEVLISIEAEVKELLSDEDLRLIYPGKKILHRECKPHPNLRVESGPREIIEFIRSSESGTILHERAIRGDLRWFKQLYSTLVSKYDLSYFVHRYSHYNVEHDNFWDDMQHLRTGIILTDKGDLAKINECYTNPKKLDIPEEIREKFKIVHPEIVKDEQFKRFREKLNEERYNRSPPIEKVIKELSGEDIKSALKTQEALALDSRTWDRMSEHEKIEKIRHVKDLWSRGLLSLEGYNFFTIKSKEGEWLRPDELFLPQEYIPEHRLEVIAREKRLLDLPLKFVSADFVKDESDDSIKQWRLFFKELGVDEKLEDKNFVKNIVQRIGILTALRFEKSKGRTAHELSRSEEMGGYDIVQLSEQSEDGYGAIQSDKGYIEVKGSRKPNPDIFLSSKQFRTLQDKQEKYYVYVVKDALRYPSLCVTRGNMLLEITDMKAIIPFNKWSNEAQEEEFQP